MDFSFSEEQEAVRGLAEQIFEGVATVERVKEVEASVERVDRELWGELAKAGLLGICLPESVGGSGLGIVEAALVLQQQGRRVAPVPLLPTLAAALTVAEHGTDEQRTELLPGVVAGDTILTYALAESGTAGPLEPATVAKSTRGGWRLTGTKLTVPAAHLAARVLVAAAAPDGTRLFLVEPSGPGVTSERAETTNREVHCHLALDDAPGDPVGGAGAPAFLLERALVGLCAIQLGVAEAALRMAADYTSNRLQFGKPLSTFQGVALKAADAFIDIEAMRTTLWQAAWRLSEGIDATAEVLVAKWWAADGGQRVVHTTQHLHGGIGADIDYPVHRYFLWGKQIEDVLGGASAQLARLGKVIASA